ncbi:MAG: glycosyltransferase family 4 protein [Oligoflexales bacterium]|nr:glycosyltransferase family 4 protein [Oligoflexales bacterium]
MVAKQTGVQRAAYNLVKTLVEIDRNNDYFLFTGESQTSNPDWNYPNVKVVTYPLKKGGHFRNHLWEQYTLPKLARSHKVDILHSPANMAPLFYKGPSIVHIHDLCFVVNPQWYSYLFHTVYNIVIPRLARKATRIITNSNNSRNDLLQFCRVDSGKVSLVYWAVDQIFTGHAVNKDSSQEISFPKEGYILYVGSLEPRKNIPILIEAYEKLRSDNPEIKTKLVLIGGENPLFAEVRLKIKKFKDDVIFKGFVNDKSLREYYRNATVVAYPSLYEGFGLPPLEAMASGVPVVTSNTSSIPEVVGTAALMVSPYDRDQLADTLARVILDKDLRIHLSKEGLMQVRKFNWYRVARNILSIYHEVINQSSSGDGAKYIPFDVWEKLVNIEKEKLFIH